MGEVYLAEDTELGRQVALKVLLSEVANDEDRVRRFVQEAKAASALNHPNILTVYEIGTFDESRFIATELIKGETLRDRLRGDSMTLREVLDVAMQVAAALNAAHNAGIVHRDIKPENIMLRDDGIAKVLDFGLAKLLQVRSAEREVRNEENPTLMQPPQENPHSALRIPHLTAPGVIMGTVVYMSPEQARGKETDARCDIWSLGIVMYEMLTKRTPFAGETANDSIAAILTKDPPSLDASTPSELQRIVRKSLQKNADERYQTVKDLLLDVKNLKRELEFSEELERSQVPQSTGASNVSTGQVAENATAIHSGVFSTQNSMPQQRSSAEYLVGEIKSHKLVVAAGLLILVLVAGFFGYRYFSSTGSKQIESIAVMPFVNESGNADVEYLSDGMTETLIKSLSNLPNLNVKPRSSVFRYKGKDTDLQTIGKELNVQAILNGRVAQRGDQLTLSLELVDVQKDKVIWTEQYQRKQSDLVSLQSEIARDVSTKLKSKLSGADVAKVEKNYTANPEAYQLYLKGRFYWNKRTSESLKQAADYFNRAIEKDPNYALAYSGLAETYTLYSSYSVALSKDSLPQAKAAAERALELDESLAGAHTALAEYHLYYEFDRVNGEKELRRAIELDPNYATAHQWLGTDVLANSKRFDEALVELRRAEELDPLSPIIGTNVADTFEQARRYDDAIVQYKRTISLDPNFGYVHNGLASTYGAKGMYPEAIAEVRKFIELSSDPTGKGFLGFCLAKSGQRAEAIKVLNELKQESSERYVQSYAFALIYIGLGQKEDALAALEKEVSDRSPNAIFCAVYPELDELRSEPRFKDLLKRMNLPE